MYGLVTNLRFFFKNLNLLIYFWLLWIFVAVHGLSLAVARGSTL